MTEIEKLHSEREQQITREPERALAMASDQWPIWEKQGQLQDGRVWMERVLSAGNKADSRTRARILCQKRDADWGLVFVLETCACSVVEQGNPADAARCWGEAVKLRTNIGAPLPDACRDIYLPFEETVKQALGEDAFQSAWQSGE